MIVESEKFAYRLFSGKGDLLSYGDIWNTLIPCDLICFGELHNNALAHWMQLEMLIDLHNIWEDNPICLCLEVLERDKQSVLDRYMNKEIDVFSLQKDANLGENFPRDYGPILDFARQVFLPAVASNIPRRIARQVYHHGIDYLLDLSDQEQALLAPLPIHIDESIPSYVAMKDMLPLHHSDMNISDFIASQAIKDATMADTIVTYLKKQYKVFHINGAYHSDYYEGIIWYILRSEGNWRIATISTVEQTAMDRLEEEHIDKADIILVANSRMPKTYLMGL